MENIFDCSICLDPYDNDAKLPRILNCGHTFCQSCITSMLDWSNFTLVCPVDKQVTYVDKVFKLMVNHALADHNAKVSQEAETPHEEESPDSSIDSHLRLCQMHNKERNLFCMHEKAFVCEDCVSIFHVGSCHTIRPADDAIEQQIEDMQRVGKELRQSYRENVKDGQQIQKSYIRHVELFDKYVADSKVAMQRRFELQMKASRDAQKTLKTQIDDLNQMCKKLKKHEDVENTLQEFTQLLTAKSDTKNHTTRYEEFSFNYHSTFRNLTQELKGVSKLSSEPVSQAKFSETKTTYGATITTAIMEAAPTDIMMHSELIARLKSKRHISSERVFNAMLRVPREDFVDDPSLAYIEKNLPFVHDHTLAAPAIVAESLENLGDKLKHGAKVLQIGVRGGYHAACFAYMVGSKGKVVVADRCRSSLEKAEACLKMSHKELLDKARIVFRKTGFENGLSELGPFDAIYVGAAVPLVPHSLINMLTQDGKMLIYTGANKMFQSLKLVQRRPNGSTTVNRLYDCRCELLCTGHQRERARPLP